MHGGSAIRSPDRHRGPHGLDRGTVPASAIVAGGLWFVAGGLWFVVCGWWLLSEASGRSDDIGFNAQTTNHQPQLAPDYASVPSLCWSSAIERRLLTPFRAGLYLSMPMATPSTPSPQSPSPSSSPSSAGADTAARRCASCGSVATTGRYCGECGAPFAGTLCPACRSLLTPGAKFCHRCGTATGSTTIAAGPIGAPDRRLATTLPWAVTALVLVALVALIAGRNFGVTFGRQGGAPDASGEVADATGSGAAGAPDGAASGDPGGAEVRAPDISTLSPRERADRLYDRVMRLAEEGKRDSVDFFAPMVTSAYQMLGPLDTDEHYDLGRIGEVTGAGGLARAEADTILRANPTHLLGLALAARLATASKQQAVARALYRRLVAAVPTERQKNRPEYARHQRDIDDALGQARKMGEQ
jgi:hypothetical protein